MLIGIFLIRIFLKNVCSHLAVLRVFSLALYSGISDHSWWAQGTILNAWIESRPCAKQVLYACTIALVLELCFACE